MRKWYEYEYARKTDGKWQLVDSSEFDRFRRRGEKFQKVEEAKKPVVDDTDYVNVFPYGKIPKEKYQACIDHNLLERVPDTEIWKLTEKCTKNYESVSFVEFLLGKREKPIRIDKKKLINDILAM